MAIIEKITILPEWRNLPGLSSRVSGHRSLRCLPTTYISFSQKCYSRLPCIQNRHCFFMAASRFFAFCFPWPDRKGRNEHIEPSRCLPLHFSISAVPHPTHSAQKYRIALRLFILATLKPFLSRVIVLFPLLNFFPSSALHPPD